MNKSTHRVRLQMLGLPIIETLDNFADISHLSKQLIYFYSSYATYNYFVYSIPKRNGGSREIAQPSRKLKAIQSWILRNILELLYVSTASKGFKKGESIATNAETHIGANSIFILDLEDFFPSIKANKVYSVFNALGYNEHISCVLTSFCTYQGYLPQGSPCSPYLSNLVSIQLDNRIQGYVGKRGINYTRYADDLTFSASGAPKLLKAYKTIKTIIEDEGFRINPNKTRISGPRQRKKVTGLVVTEKDYGIGRKKYRKLRAKVYNLTKVIPNNFNSKLINQLKGELAFVKDVDRKRFNTLLINIKAWKIKFPNSALILV